MEKNLTSFYKNKMCKDGYRNFCKECCKENQKEYRQENREEILIKKRLDYELNRTKYLEQKKLKYYTNPFNNDEQKKDRQNRRTEISKKNKKEYQKKYRKLRSESDPLFRVKYNIRRRLNDFLKNRAKRTSEILGCTYNEFINHIENLFKEGMSWDNYGLKGWHLDHIYPLAKAKTEEEIYKLNHYLNFQPLWWYENLHKSDKLPQEMNNEAASQRII
jgi:hypothetical protein